MNIALIHYRVGETDGVSLEMDKWKKILENMGHKVYYIAGSEGTSKAIIIPEIYYRDDYELMLNDECYLSLNHMNEDELKEAILKRAEIIEQKLINIIKEYQIELIVPNNVLSLGRSLHIGMAITQAIKKTGVKVICHHHDFYWEREYFLHPTTEFVTDQLKKYFPPTEFDQQMRHAVINTLAKKDLKEKKGLEATVVPNVFDFKAPEWVKDDYNHDFKEALGVKDDQILFLQATRVTNRKAIELAIDLIALLNEPKNKEYMIGKVLYDGRLFTEKTEYVLALIGLHEGGDGYEEKIIAHAKEKGIKIIVKQDLIDHSRHIEKDGKKIYSLWDAYVYSDIITYPSIYEGWGNQFLEGLFAKKPQVVFEYSIYDSDIKDKGFNIISLGNTYKTLDNGLVAIDDQVLEDAAKKTMMFLTDKNLYDKTVEDNFNKGEKYFSMEALETILSKLFSNI